LLTKGVKEVIIILSFFFLFNICYLLYYLLNKNIDLSTIVIYADIMQWSTIYFNKGNSTSKKNAFKNLSKGIINSF